MKLFFKIEVAMFGLLLTSIVCAQSKDIFNVKDFGAIGDGVTLNTAALQSAIDKCSKTGGTVFFPAGKYLTGSLELKDDVTLYLDNGAAILGSTNIADYQPHQPKMKSYNDAFLRYSLFNAEGVKNISIEGEGIIDGQGGAFKVKTKIKPDRYKNRPFIIRFVECKNIKVENVTLQNSAMWMQQYLACTGLRIHGIKVFNHANQNNDMMDIDGCKDVIISDCTGDTDDDGIVLKSTSPSITENVVITNCIVSSHCNAIKMGTESTGGFRNVTISNMVVRPSKMKKVIFGYPEGTSGITLATVDGGILEDVTISNVIIDGPQVPICLRLGNRARKYTESAPTPGVGIFKNVIIDNVIAKNVGSIGCSITGIPNHKIENITLSNIKIIFGGGVKKEEYKTEVAEKEDNYPEGTMWGNLPAYGFYIRHAQGVKLDNVDISFDRIDERPAIVMDDVDGIKISGLNAAVGKNASSLIGINKSKDVCVQNSKSTGRTNAFVAVKDTNSKNIFLLGNDLRNFNTPFISKTGEQVKLISNINF